MASLSVYASTSDGAWQWSSDALVLSLPNLNFTGPTRRGSEPRRFLDYSSTDTRLHEYQEQTPGQWTEVAQYTNDDLGVTYFSQPTLSADGLRLTFLGALTGASTSSTNYSDRPSVNDRFTPGVPLKIEFTTAAPFLSEDCARLYTDGLGVVFYAQQR